MSQNDLAGGLDISDAGLEDVTPDDVVQELDLNTVDVDSSHGSALSVTSEHPLDSPNLQSLHQGSLGDEGTITDLPIVQPTGENPSVSQKDVLKSDEDPSSLTSLSSSDFAIDTAIAASTSGADPNSLQTPSIIAPTQSTIIAPPPASHGYYSTIRMNLPGQGPPMLGGTTTSSRKVKQYQLDDGTLVSGKGLGRGRPGVKRGPRKSSLAESGSSTPGLFPKPGLSLQSSEPLTKRRRMTLNAQNIKAEALDSDSALSASLESTPEYNPTEETRSGRKIQKPPAAPVIVSESASPASKRPKLDNRTAGSTSSPALKLHPKIKRRLYRGREQLALCEHCQRGHGPFGNAIVFCDACNKCWHQRCHEPQVAQSVISDAKAEWFCANCEKILHGKKGKKAKAGESNVQQAQSAVPQFVGPLIGGAALTQAHKIAFLESRTREQLISLILQGSDLAPALPMFQAPAPQLPQAQFKSNYVTPISSTPGLHNATATGEPEDEGYDSYFDDHAALYPKPGQGVKLPPDTVDLHMLLEHPHSRTFSHWMRGMPTREYSGNADLFQRQ